MPLNQLFYMVVRVFMIGQTATPQRSVEFFNDFRQAQTRYFNIITADLGNDNVCWHGAFLMDNNGHNMETPRIFDRRDFSEPEPETVTESVEEG